MAPARSAAAAVVLCGDLNATPDEPLHAVFAGAGYTSAHAAARGREPHRTWPTGIVAPFAEAGTAACLDYVYTWAADGHACRQGGRGGVARVGGASEAGAGAEAGSTGEGGAGVCCSLSASSPFHSLPPALVRAVAADVCADAPAPHDATLFASDHAALKVTVEVERTGTGRRRRG